MPPFVHPNVQRLFVGIIRYNSYTHSDRNRSQYGANPEVPSPSQVIS